MQLTSRIRMVALGLTAFAFPIFFGCRESEEKSVPAKESKIESPRPLTVPQVDDPLSVETLLIKLLPLKSNRYELRLHNHSPAEVSVYIPKSGRYQLLKASLDGKPRLEMQAIDDDGFNAVRLDGVTGVEIRCESDWVTDLSRAADLYIWLEYVVRLKDSQGVSSGLFPVDTGAIQK